MPLLKLILNPLLCWCRSLRTAQTWSRCPRYATTLPWRRSATTHSSTRTSRTSKPVTAQLPRNTLSESRNAQSRSPTTCGAWLPKQQKIENTQVWSFETDIFLAIELHVIFIIAGSFLSIKCLYIIIFLYLSLYINTLYTVMRTQTAAHQFWLFVRLAAWWTSQINLNRVDTSYSTLLLSLRLKTIYWKL